mmetsp:Transcript_19505/g.52153  ORF Transcript_19505/g.52153 Transcript_19505/m.52153 type:complete len:864 (+) Transcript_19505:115-2706(+)
MRGSLVTSAAFYVSALTFALNVNTGFSLKAVSKPKHKVLNVKAQHKHKAKPKHRAKPKPSSLAQAGPTAHAEAQESGKVDVWHAVEQLKAANKKVCVTVNGPYMGGMANVVAFFNEGVEFAERAGIPFVFPPLRSSATTHKDIGDEFVNLFGHAVAQEAVCGGTAYRYEASCEKPCKSFGGKGFCGPEEKWANVRRCPVANLSVDLVSDPPRGDGDCQCPNLLVLDGAGMAFWGQGWDYKKTHGYLSEHYWQADANKAVQPVSFAALRHQVKIPAQAFSVVAHVRLGDVKKAEAGSKIALKKADPEWILAALQKVAEKLPESCASITLVTDSEDKEGGEVGKIVSRFASRTNGRKISVVGPEAATADAFRLMTHANVLLAGGSDFSRLAAVLARNTSAVFVQDFQNSVVNNVRFSRPSLEFLPNRTTLPLQRLTAVGPKIAENKALRRLMRACGALPAAADEAGSQPAVRLQKVRGKVSLKDGAAGSKGSKAGAAQAKKAGADASANATYVAAYQAFMDKWPVTRYNMFKSFSRVTKYGRHKFPSTVLESPGLFKKFDWVVTGPYSHKHGEDPKTLFVQGTPDQLDNLLETAREQFDSSRHDRVLVLGGSDMWLSEVLTHTDNFHTTEHNPEGYHDLIKAQHKKINGTLAELHKYFGRIFFEAKDMHIGDVRTMPIGLTEFNLRRQDVFDTCWPEVEAAGVSAEKKPHGVLAAFGIYHDLSHCNRGLGRAVELREEARAWSNSSAALAAGVRTGIVEPLDWWKTLSAHKFMMAPAGCGVQAPKQLEALMVLTIPIHHRAFPAWDDLKSYGFPIVVVSDWSEVTKEATGRWWKELSPRLVSFRENCLTTEGYWKLFTGQVEYCS